MEGDPLEELEGARITAIQIFDEYLKNHAKYYIELNESIRCTIFQKFGCQLVGKSAEFTKKSILSAFIDEPESYNTEVLDLDILNQNLN